MTTTSLTLVEVIQGVGCIARDSVQGAGEDILFLSNTGVRSLNRTVQEKSLPMRDISKNVRDDVISAVGYETLANIKSVYSPSNSFYLLTFPTSRQTYCFDTRQALEDGSYRTTVWPSFIASGFLATGTELFFAGVDGIAKYTTYKDNGAAYLMTYYSNYFDLEMPNINKIVKKITATTVGVSGQSFSLQVGYEYSPKYFSETFTLVASEVTEFGIAEFNLSEYTGGVLVNDQSSPARGAGNILQVGFTAEIAGNAMSLQRLSIFAKQGKVI